MQGAHAVMWASIPPRYCISSKPIINNALACIHCKAANCSLLFCCTAANPTHPCTTQSNFNPDPPAAAANQNQFVSQGCSDHPTGHVDPTAHPTAVAAAAAASQLAATPAAVAAVVAAAAAESG